MSGHIHSKTYTHDLLDQIGSPSNSQYPVQRYYNVLYSKDSYNIMLIHTSLRNWSLSEKVHDRSPPQPQQKYQQNSDGKCFTIQSLRLFCCNIFDMHHRIYFRYGRQEWISNLNFYKTSYVLLRSYEMYCWELQKRVELFVWNIGIQIIIAYTRERFLKQVIWLMFTSVGICYNKIESRDYNKHYSSIY